MTYDVAAITASDAFKTAQTTLRDQHDLFVSEIIELTEIPAPPFMEERRSLAYEQKFLALGLEEVHRDEIGNVLGIRRGRGNGQMICVAAHLDTVFPEGTDCTVRREGTKLFAPGVGDDTRGLAAVLAFIRALDAAGIETEQDLLFVGNVGEEGKGDLRGMRHLFTKGKYRDQIAGFFTVDGLRLEEVTTTAIGSYRYRVAFDGPGGHSLAAFGTVNPAYALGTLLTGMAGWEVPESPRTSYCASVVGGGTSVNAIPEQIWIEVDLRSESQSELDRLDGLFHGLIAEATAAENARASTVHGEIVARIERIGNRPAGATPHDSRIVQAAFAALPLFGFEKSTGSSSTDANIAMSLGIPAIRLGSGGDGGRAHSLDEWIDVEIEESLRGLNAGLATILGTVGVATDAA
ncbi:M20/M25/M40 family metallo-hydrolase [Maritimibacter alkaliphilus]|uniref:M20/M25/M40 family metallo-hydrolase n=1 Tax=Maritimibacter alkaliphilus TaxID=404236 RepID=UPI001C95E09C|nr:M20/M25/M40 family metallo-hydrolase [Maritimibacter alkaliphilus]MBY6089900.1 M20/M25/M40 family metallo-hydrolase [Maritimibacter alkaliphilus]